MNQEKSAELIAIFPEIFSDDPNLYFECGNGWYNLLKKCIEDIKTVIERDNIDDFKVTQIKEKYGTLRFYTSFTDENVSAIIRRAEYISSQTCEVCGKQGNYMKWYTTLCSECGVK